MVACVSEQEHLTLPRKHHKRENVMAEFDLVFEGGGAKGIVFVGALNALLAGGHSYRRLIGTSAGAITYNFCFY